MINAISYSHSNKYYGYKSLNQQTDSEFPKINCNYCKKEHNDVSFNGWFTRGIGNLIQSIGFGAFVLPFAHMAASDWGIVASVGEHLPYWETITSWASAPVLIALGTIIHNFGNTKMAEDS